MQLCVRYFEIVLQLLRWTMVVADSRRVCCLELLLGPVAESLTLLLGPHPAGQKQYDERQNRHTREFR